MKVPGLLARHGSRQRSRWHASNTQRSPSHPQSYHHYHQPQSLHAALEARLGCVTRRNVRTSTVFEQAPRASRNKATPRAATHPYLSASPRGPFSQGTRLLPLLPSLTHKTVLMTVMRDWEGP